MTRMNQLIRIFVSLAAFWLIAGCGDDASVPDDPDAAVMIDGNPVVDAPDTCGDRIIDVGEQCDDGNNVDGDGCDARCAIEVSPTCGDSNVDYDQGEQCDDGNTANGDGCDSQCQVEAPATCGDGNLDLALGEQCDDGNTAPGDGCSPNCQYEQVGAFCGDGIVDSNEVCDDGNTANGDGCNATCNFTTQTELFVGTPGMVGATDGTGPAALIGGYGALATDDQYLWYADGTNLVVRRIDVTTAQVQTVAGDGQNASVDNPDGAQASFSSIEAITTDGNTVWVGGARRIRAVQVDAPYGVTTVAGNGTLGCNDGIGAAAQFDDLRGLTYYNGYVWFLDANCATVRRFDPTTDEVLTVAGTAGMTGTTDGIGPAARFISPRYMASDNSGNLFIADTNGATIRALNTVTMEVTTFAGNGTAGYTDGIGILAQIDRPRGMTSDGTSIYWVEFNMHTIRQGQVATQEVTTMIGAPGMNGYTEGIGAMARLDRPYGVAFHFPSRSMFVIDSDNSVIRRIR